MSDLSVDIGGLELANPVMTASGTFGYGREYDDLVDLNRLGAIIVKGISLAPSAGNPPPRIVETTGGLLNAIGLENIGLEAFVRDKLPFLTGLSSRLLVNIYGREIEEYAALAGELSGLEAIDGLEINISCPNVKTGGLAFGVDPGQAAAVVGAVRKRTRQHLMVKLTPNVTEVGVIARSVAEAGADSISLINTLGGMAVDIHTRRPRLSTITGGLSGPAIKPVALKMAWEVARQVQVPVIGLGGILTATDALEFLMAGATAVQVGTANFVNPRATMDIVAGIDRFLDDRQIPAVADIIGSLDVS
ncbi:MAG: dihydroorotate dehydrogenase [Desulfosudaceae bacterium]